MRASRNPKKIVILTLLILCRPLIAQAGWWENQLDWPPILEEEPEGALPPDFQKPGLHILSVFELMTDLGRQQAHQIDALVKETDGVAGCFSMDRVAQKWTHQYIADFRSQEKVGLPFFSIEDSGLRGLFRGYDTDKMRIFPQTLVVDASGTIHSILRGVQSSDQLKVALERSKTPWKDIDPVDVEPAKNLVQNGDFEQATSTNEISAWGTYQAGKGTALQSKGTGWRGGTSLEIRSDKEKEYQIAFQIIPHRELLGQTVRLSSLAQSNSLGVPQVALAVPHPQLDDQHKFVPRAPIKTRSGQGIPLRIVGNLLFEKDHSQWQQLSSEVAIPPDARALVLVLYLDNPKASGGAARFDEVRLEAR
ncbi:MAG: hypothetical protein KC994_05335 [Candidatus Omnitrophica bacterium]|nr:hypothetical protein [Candidatus Omnitrophota bacterium]